MSIGRNAPCPCGSGRKYKRCCLAQAAAEIASESDAIAAQRKAHEWLQARFGKLKQREISEDCLAVVSEKYPPDESDDEDPVSDFVANLGEGDLYVLNTGLNDWALHETKYERHGTSARGIEHVLQAGDLRLTASQRAFLEATAQSWLHVYEVAAVEVDRGLHLRDVLQPHRPTLFVHEAVATRGLVAGSLIGARMIEHDGRLELGGAIYPLSPIGVLEILLDEDFTGDADPRDASLAGHIRDSWLYDRMRSPIRRALPLPRPPFLEDRYDVLDPAALTAALDTHNDIRRVNYANDPMWIYEPGDGETDMQVLSHPRTEGGEPDLSTLIVRNPDEISAAAGRAWLESMTDACLRHHEQAYIEPPDEDRFHLPLPANEAGATEAKPGHEQIHAELVARYADWCDTPLVILGERTPRVMLADPATNRYRVELLLRIYDDVEAAFAKATGRAPLSFDFLRERLGLPGII